MFGEMGDVSKKTGNLITPPPPQIGRHPTLMERTPPIEPAIETKANGVVPLGWGALRETIDIGWGGSRVPKPMPETERSRTAQARAGNQGQARPRPGRAPHGQGRLPSQGPPRGN